MKMKRINKDFGGLIFRCDEGHWDVALEIFPAAESTDEGLASTDEQLQAAVDEWSAATAFRRHAAM